MNYPVHIYSLAWGMVNTLTNLTKKRLISMFENAEAAWLADKKSLIKEFKITQPKILDFFSQPREHWLEQALQEHERACKLGVELLFFTDVNYPKRLKELPDAPVLIYKKGKALLDYDKQIAIVGTRQSTDYGQKVVVDLIENLKPYGVCVVSGLAFGIDIIAHKACLKAGLPTVAVMANGIENVFPTTHKNIAAQMLENGALITENKIGTIPHKTMFPARNRIIAGLADAVVVVEAAEKGGALITAHFANDYNREVFAVPGHVYQTQSLGCNALIKNHSAHIYTGVQDLAESLGWVNTGVGFKNTNAYSPAEPLDISHLTEVEQKVALKLMEEKNIHIDELAWKTEMPLNQLASVLITLEFEGLVNALPGKKFAWNIKKIV